MWLTLLLPFKSYIIQFICFHASNAFCNQSHTWNAFKLHVKFTNPLQWIDQLLWAQCPESCPPRWTATPPPPPLCPSWRHTYTTNNTKCMFPPWLWGHHRGMHLCLLCLSACLPTGYCVGWFVHINCCRVCLSASDHSVYVENITRPRIDRTPAGDASGQESTLLTVPSNAPYITYTDADGQVYRRRRRMSLPR